MTYYGLEGRVDERADDLCGTFVLCLGISRVCHVQNNKYDYAKKDAEALAKSKK